MERNEEDRAEFKRNIAVHYHPEQLVFADESHFVTISDLALFNFLLLYNVASKVSPTWLTPVYL